MKNITSLFLIFSLAFSSYQCGDSGISGSSTKDGLTLSGNMKGANAMQVYFDKVGISPTSASLVQAKVEASPNGDFNLVLPNTPKPGIYRLRIGAQKVNLILDGTEKAISINGDLSQLNTFQYEISGSEGSSSYQDFMQRAAKRQVNIADVKNYVESSSNSLASVLVATQTLQGNRKFADVYNSIKDKLAAQFPGSSYVNDYNTYLAGIMKVSIGGRGFQFVEESTSRQPAPDIKLPNPSGKEYALSDLKGNVVLLDFWASWCRPCRAENPNVVKIYNKYKDQGFTVFSVSLDGVDSRTAARYQNDTKKVAKAREDQKKRWKNAIDQDGLIWDYHVSDLKKWECVPAKSYGVSSIPRTFMIDKDGNIAAMNLRGAEQIEDTLLKLL